MSWKIRAVIALLVVQGAACSSDEDKCVDHMLEVVTQTMLTERLGSTFPETTLEACDKIADQWWTYAGAEMALRRLAREIPWGWPVPIYDQTSGSEGYAAELRDLAATGGEAGLLADLVVLNWLVGTFRVLEVMDSDDRERHLRGIGSVLFALPEDQFDVAAITDPLGHLDFWRPRLPEGEVDRIAAQPTPALATRTFAEVLSNILNADMVRILRCHADVEAAESLANAFEAAGTDDWQQASSYYEANRDYFDARCRTTSE